MISLIIPCAGKSSRFPGKPKWLLTCPNGSLMIQEAIRCLDLENVDQIYVTFVKEHTEKYFPDGNVAILFKDFENVHITILDDFTGSQTETVYLTILKNNIKDGVFVKDCDSYYNHKIERGNYACSLKICEENNVSKIHNKSFIESNSLNQITHFCEKKIIGDTICVGGYSFEDSRLFTEYYEKCKDAKVDTKEFHISHLIHFCLLDGKIFYKKEVTKFIDWGTPDEWRKYRDSFRTLFLDIDGTIFHNSGEYLSPIWGETTPIQNNTEKIKKLYNDGKTQIILTTSRKEQYRERTESQLKKYDIPYDKIIFGLHHAKRVLINDFSETNPYPTAISVNLKRDSGDLEFLI
jgi:hypothetical protein